MEDPIFSVIIPVYKVENYLDKCVQSIINQTYPDIEIILVDDGSPDRCGEMCDAYARQDSRIKVVHKENGGLSDARNTGIRAATGAYLMFVDSDDFIAEDTCGRLLPLAREGYDVLIGDGMSMGASKRLSHGYTAECVSGQAYLKLALRGGSMPMAAWLYVYNRDFLLHNSLWFKNGILHEDEQFTPRVFLAAERVIETGVNFYRYQIREGSITTGKDYRKNGRDLYETCLELQAIYEKLEDTELKERLLDSLAVKYLSICQDGRLYRYGKEYIHKAFVRANAHSRKTRAKAALFCVSPRLYWHVNHISKQVKLYGNRKQNP